MHGRSWTSKAFALRGMCMARGPDLSTYRIADLPWQELKRLMGMWLRRRGCWRRLLCIPAYCRACETRIAGHCGGHRPSPTLAHTSQASDLTEQLPSSCKDTRRRAYRTQRAMHTHLRTCYMCRTSAEPAHRCVPRPLAILHHGKGLPCPAWVAQAMITPHFLARGVNMPSSPLPMARSKRHDEKTCRTRQS